MVRKLCHHYEWYKRSYDYVSGFVMVNGMTSGFTINHIFVKILIIIDKYLPLAVTLNIQFIALVYKHI